MLDAETGTWHIVGDPDKSLTWSQVAAAADQGLIVANVRFTADRPTFPFGTHLSLVEVDTETGKVTLLRHVTADDAGPVLNPILLEGQRHGGIAQGAAQALCEEILYDSDGNPLTSTLADYAAITATELPSFELLTSETPTTVNPLGVKGIGEAGTIGATPAVHNAVIDAVSHLGVRHIDMPMTPERVWTAIQKASAAVKVELTVNGKEITADVEDRTLLVHFLRDTAELTATNIGCDTTSCGACTVLLDGESVKSCTVLAAQADGRSVTTLEGLASDAGEMHPVQRAFHTEHGLQCGYCTPGMVMAIVSLLKENPSPTEEEVRVGLEGNICRCTGYHNIVKAALVAAASVFRQVFRLRGVPVIPPSFTYLRASSVDEALGLAAEHGEDAKYLAGGHSLLPMMKLRMAFPEVLIDLGRITELSYIRDGGSYVAVGAMTRHHDVATSPLLASAIPLLAHTAGEVGDPQIRHRGTIGGSVAHGDAASDLPATLLALDATFVIRGASGTRSVPAAEFFKSHLRDRDRARRAAHRDPGAQAGRAVGLVVPEVHQAEDRLGDRRGGGAGVVGAGIGGGLDQHGPDPAARARRRVGARVRGVHRRGGRPGRRGDLGRLRHPREQGLSRAPRAGPGQARPRGGGRQPIAACATRTGATMRE